MIKLPVHSSQLSLLVLSSTLALTLYGCGGNGSDDTSGTGSSVSANQSAECTAEGSGTGTATGTATGTDTGAGTGVATGTGTLTGITRAKAEKIWYRALTVYMTSNTNYKGARTATLNAARDLYGAGSTTYNTVAAAWSAVSVS